jgi:hypothetical protein
VWLDEVQISKTHPTNLEHLKDKILKLWALRMDNSPYLKKLEKLMLVWLQEVIDWGGNVTHY